jgi:hypothetical protein
MKNKQKVKPTSEPEIGLNPESEAPQHANEPIDEGAEINRLLDEGYSVKQIVDLGFKRRTAYHYAKLRMQPENESAGSGQGDGASAGQTSKGKQELIKLGAKDVIPPEAVLEVLHLPRNGDAVEVWRRGVLDGVGILLLGARYSQLTAAGQAEIVKNQLDIMREAKDSSKDIAQEAAHQAAFEVARFIEQKLPKSESTGEPSIADRMLGPMADMAGRQMANIFERMFGMSIPGQPGQESQFQVPSGWGYKNEGGGE